MYEEIRICKLFFFFLEKGGLQINRAYELLEIQLYMNITLVSVYTVVWVPQVYSCCSDPTPRERVWWHLADSSGFVHIDRFLPILVRNLQPPITLQKTQSVVKTPESLGFFSTMTHHFFGDGR